MDTHNSKASTSAVPFVGPIRHHDVVVHGWRVPHLSATPLNGGRVHLTLDSQFGIDPTVEEAERIVPFLSDYIAIASGHTGHPGQDGLQAPIGCDPMLGMRSL